MDRESSDATNETAAWRPYTRAFLIAVMLELALVCVLILAANPYGNLPHSLFREHAILDTNQRFQYPAVVKSGKFDSIVIGTSTSRLLRPEALNAAFGGRFANLAMDAGTAWEQVRLASFFAARTPAPGTLLVGLDHAWCNGDADRRKISERGFPAWMYDDNPWNDLLWLLNKKSAEISLRRIAYALGLNSIRIPFDGYEVFVPPETQYDLAKARAKIAKRSVDRAAVTNSPQQEGRAAWAFPAVPWLDGLLDLGWRRVVLYFPPVHISAQPTPGDPAAWREEECKARIADVARRHNVPVIDFRIASQITSNDENYWDSLHYRVAIAERVVTELRQALNSGRDDPAGDWHVLSPGPIASAVRF